MKYKVIKNINIKSILNAQVDIGCNEFKSHLSTFIVQVETSLSPIAVNLDYIKPHFNKYPEWKTFLIKHEFIEEIKIKLPKLVLEQINENKFVVRDLSLSHNKDLIYFDSKEGVMYKAFYVDLSGIWKLGNSGKIKEG